MKRLKKLNAYLKLPDEFLVIYNACNLYPRDFKNYDVSLIEKFEFGKQVLQEAKSVYPRDLLRQTMYLDQHTFLCSLLDRNDRTTMGASIECREPFLDYRLVEMLANVPISQLAKGKKGKYLLMETFGKQLPQDIRKFKKWGFSVPWSLYLRTNVIFSQELLDSCKSELFETGLLRYIPFDKIVTEFLKGNDDNEMLVRQLFFIIYWKKIYFDRLKQLR